MADKYLVPCTCGKSVSVSVHQAGSQVECNCGNSVGVPPLRKLRDLPRDEAVQTETTTAWTPRHAIALGGAVPTLILLAVAGWMTYRMPEMPDFGKINEQWLSANLEVSLEKGKPIDFWQHHIRMMPMLAEQGFEEVNDPRRAFVEQVITQRVLYRNIVLAAAGVVAALTIVGLLLSPKPTEAT